MTSRSIHRFLQHLIKPAASHAPPTTLPRLHTPRWPPWQPSAYLNTSSEEAQASRPRRGVGLVAELRHMLMVPDTYLKMSSLQNEEEKVDLIVKVHQLIYNSEFLLSSHCLTYLGQIVQAVSGTSSDHSAVMSGPTML